MAEYFGMLLDSSPDHADQRIDSRTLVSAVERQRIVVEWNGSAAP